MAIRDADLWHQVHAEREDGVTATFLVRDVKPRHDQPQIFVIELPYPVTDDSRLPDAASYHRLDTFQEQWVEPACEALGWTLVAWKSEDGSFFLYLYGNGDPNALLERLAPFDEALGFFHDRDADWSEYAALRDLVDQSLAAPEADEDGHEDGHVHTDACDHDHTHDHDHTSNGILVIDRTGEGSTTTTTKARAANGQTGRVRTAPAGTTDTRTTTKASRLKQGATKPPRSRARTSKPARPATTAKSAKRPAKKPVATKSAMTKSSAKKSSASRSPTRSAARKGGAKRPATKRR